jgi:hypothetical protein
MAVEVELNTNGASSSIFERGDVSDGKAIRGNPAISASPASTFKVSKFYR